MDKSDYLLSDAGGIRKKWLGVRNKLDKKSIDIWANLIGYVINWA